MHQGMHQGDIKLSFDFGVENGEPICTFLLQVRGHGVNIKIIGETLIGADRRTNSPYAGACCRVAGRRTRKGGRAAGSCMQTGTRMRRDNGICRTGGCGATVGARTWWRGKFGRGSAAGRSNTQGAQRRAEMV